MLFNISTALNRFATMKRMTNKKLKKIAFSFIILTGVSLVALAILVHFRSILGTDIFLSSDLQSGGETPERRTVIYHILYTISLFGKPIIAGVAVFAAGLLFWKYKYYRETIYILLTPISGIVNSLIKLIVNRPRPTSNLVEIWVQESGKSFPSGHVTFYTVFFGLIFVVLFFAGRIPKTVRIPLQALSLFLIITVSFSRIYLGAHWLSDTIGGYLLGALVLSIFLYFYLKPKLPTK